MTGDEAVAVETVHWRLLGHRDDGGGFYHAVILGEEHLIAGLQIF